MSALTHARSAVVPRDCSECESDSVVGVEANLVHEAVEPPLVEDSLYFAEGCLNRVEFGAVAHVEHRSNIELLVPRSHLR